MGYASCCEPGIGGAHLALDILTGDALQGIPGGVRCISGCVCALAHAEDGIGQLLHRVPFAR
jgi:hypothetical protein